MPVVMSTRPDRWGGENGRVEGGSHGPRSFRPGGPAGGPRLGASRRVCHRTDTPCFLAPCGQFTARCKEESRDGWLTAPWQAGGPGVATTKGSCRRHPVPPVNMPFRVSRFIFWPPSRRVRGSPSLYAANTSMVRRDWVSGMILARSLCICSKPVQISGASPAV